MVMQVPQKVLIPLDCFLFVTDNIVFTLVRKGRQKWTYEEVHKCALTFIEMMPDEMLCLVLNGTWKAAKLIECDVMSSPSAKDIAKNHVLVRPALMNSPDLVRTGLAHGAAYGLQGSMTISGLM